MTAAMKSEAIDSWQEGDGKPTQCVEKQRLYSANEGPYSQGYGLPRVMYGCENWIVKKAECQRIDAFELWCWRRILKVPWTGRRSDQSILREINLKYLLEWLIGKAPDDGKDWRRIGHQRIRWLDGIINAVDISLGELQEMVRNREAWHSAVHGTAKSWTWLGKWTTTQFFYCIV